MNFSSDIEEARWIVNDLVRRHSDGYSWKDMMIITRTHSLHVLAGKEKAIGMAVRNNKVTNRFTALEWRLKKHLAILPMIVSSQVKSD